MPDRLPSRAGVTTGRNGPLDEGVSSNQHYLYVLADGVHQLVGYSVGQDGSLTQVTSVAVTTGSGGIGVS
jgi:hypothetical protein